MDVIVIITACIIMLGYLVLTGGCIWLMNKQFRNYLELIARIFENK